jgi:hypothetical protein
LHCEASGTWYEEADMEGLGSVLSLQLSSSMHLGNSNLDMTPGKSLQIKVVGLSEIDCVFELIWKLDLCSAESRLYRWGRWGQMGTDGDGDDDSQTVSAFHQGFNLQ